MAARAVTWSLRIFPSFCLGNGLFYVINIGDDDEWVKGGTISSVWDKDVLFYEVIFLVIQTFVYLLLAIEIDRLSHDPKIMMLWSKFVRTITCSSLLSSSEVNIRYTNAVDDDVEHEQQRVNNDQATSDLIVVKQLTKIYDNGKLAVDKMSLGIPHGECFGLLGVNGMSQDVS